MLKRNKPHRVQHYVYASSRSYAQSSSHSVFNHLRLRSIFLVGAILAILLAAVLAFVLLRDPSPGTSQQASSVLSTEDQEKKQPIPPPIDQAALNAEIQKVINANPQLDIGVSVKDLATGQNYSYGVDAQFIAASVGKLLTATLYLHGVENGTYTLDDMVGDTTSRAQIQKMIGQSDNAAWKLLNDLMGHPALEEYAQSIGVTSYDAEENKIKPNDVVLILSQLYQEKLLNEDHTRFLLTNMQQDQEEIQFIRRYIDPSISVYHKAGWLSDRAHDTAIVENPDRAYVLVIFTKARYGDYNFEKGQQIFSALTTTTQEIMQKK